MLKFEPNINGLTRHIPIKLRYNDHITHSPFSTHRHGELEFLYLRRGTLEIEMNHSSYHLQPGDVMIINPMEMHSGTVPADCSEIYYNCIQINTDFLYRTPNLESDQFLKQLQQGKFLLHRHLTKSVAEKNGITAHLERIIELLDSPPSLQEMALFGEVSLLLFDLFDRDLYHHSMPKNDKHTEFVNQVSTYVDEHYTEHLTTETVAAQFNYNKSYFCRRFRQEFGMTFSHHLRRLRIYKAMTHPLLNQCSWEDLAFYVGFSNYQYFYRAFREQFGFSPEQYKQKHQAGSEKYFRSVINTNAIKKGKKNRR